MSFKLTISIDDKGQYQEEIDGDINYLVLLGILENMKHSVFKTIEGQQSVAIPQQSPVPQDVKEGGE